MEHFIDIYNKKSKGREYVETLLNLPNIKINLKVDGKPFQVLYNEKTDEIEWHGRSGNETTVGPLIDDYTRLFSKAVNDALHHLGNRIYVIKNYKFLTFEVIDSNLLLTAVTDKNNRFIEDSKSISDIAKILDCGVMPTLWEGKLSDLQKSSILQILETGIVPEKDNFIKWTKEMFGSYNKFPSKLISASDDFIEGIVFFFYDSGKIIEYKLVDPTYRKMMKDRDEGLKAKREKYANVYNKCYMELVNWFSVNGLKLDNNHVISMQKNWAKFVTTDIYAKLVKEMSKIDIEENDRYSVQNDRLINQLKNVVTKTPQSKSLFELFMKTFYKEKKRTFIISPEFQNKINTIVKLMESEVVKEHSSITTYLISKIN